MLNPPLVLAALSAGLLGGLHCIGMCGGITSMLVNAGNKVIPIQPLTPPSNRLAALRIPLQLHSGRIFTYMLMGASAGYVGAAGMRMHPFLPIHTILFVFGNLALIWLAMRLLGNHFSFALFDRLLARILNTIHFSPRFNLLAQTQRMPFLVGMAWGLLPCGLVYGVLPFALLSGNAMSGAILLLIFGLSALPHLLFAQFIANWAYRSTIPRVLRYCGAAMLMGVGITGLWWSFNMQEMPAFLCITPVR